MHLSIRLLFALLLSGISSFTLQAQASPSASFPVKISLLDQSVAFPSLRFREYPYNPAFIVGSERLLKAGPKHDLHLTGNLGFYHHEYLRTAVFLQSELGYRRQLGRWALAGRVGLAYTHAFATAPVYVFEGTDYQEGNNSGQPVFTPSVGLELAYQFRQEPQAPALFVSYLFSIDSPFAILPIPHVFVGAGVRFYPFQ